MYLNVIKVSFSCPLLLVDTVDIAEAKGFCEANFSHIYHILYDTFIQAENNLRQRGKFNVVFIYVYILQLYLYTF